MLCLTPNFSLPPGHTFILDGCRSHKESILDMSLVLVHIWWWQMKKKFCIDFRAICGRIFVENSSGTVINRSGTERQQANIGKSPDICYLTCPGNRYFLSPYVIDYFFTHTNYEHSVTMWGSRYLEISQYSHFDTPTPLNEQSQKSFPQI